MSDRTALFGMVAVSAAVLTAAGRPTLANGETGTMVVHRDDGVNGYTADIGGGEFGISSFSDPSILAPASPPMKVLGFDFQTFCLEGGIGIPQDTPVAWTVNADVNGSSPIAPQTAYLFTRFWEGSLPGYDYALGAGRKSSARDLQEAIWFFQGQWQGAVDAAAQVYVDAANAAVAGSWGNTVGNVRALTTQTASGAAAQDLLVLIPEPGQSRLRLTKTASPNPVAPGQPVTYQYVVENTGGKTLTDIVVVDDNGTPADTSDDFVAGTAASLAPGASVTFTFTLVPPVPMCMNVNGGIIPVGTLYVTTLGNGDTQVKYVQSRNVVDNTYGANVSPGYPKGHTFSNLTGSDKAEFRFRDANGNLVLDFFADYLTASSSYPSGYGTLGASGGDGKLVSGSLANIVSIHTSISDTLNQAPSFYGFVVDSPAEPNPSWDYFDSYTVVVKAATFGAAGFGSVQIPSVHNSPSKLGFNAVYPTPCDGEITNTATATAHYVDNGVTMTTSATDDATVVIGSGSSGGQSDVQQGAVTLKDRTVTILLTDNGSVAATLAGLKLTWPAGNKKLQQVKLDGATIFDKKAAPTSATITTWKGHLQDRQIKAGGTRKLVLVFEAKAATTGYSLQLDFGAGFVPFTLP